MNKKYLIYASAVIAGINAEADPQACMYCKRADSNAGYLVSYDYCPDVDEEKCIKNYWKYIWKEQCLTEVKAGWTLDIDNDCGALTDINNCSPSWTSEKSFYGQDPIRSSRQMAENNKCSILLDATEATARITIEGRDARSVGVLFPGYVQGQPITVPEG